MYLKGNPRKFSDKIALIKQKEALTNASFNSAIHGITKITVNNQSGLDLNIGDIKDNNSTNSYSPDSFTSESPAVSFKNNVPSINDNSVSDSVNMTSGRENDVFRSSDELSQVNDNIYQGQPCRDEIKFRHVSDRSNMKTNDARYSNIDGYFLQNKNLKRLCETGSSGSLPNVSVWNNNAEFQTKYADEGMKNKEFVKKHYRDMQQPQLNLDKRIFTTNTKSVLAEHLKHREPLNSTTIQNQDLINGSNQIYRTRKHGFDYGDTHSTGNLMTNSQLPYNHDPNNPYLSLPHNRRAQYNSDFSRQSYTDGITNSSKKYMRLNTNCYNDNQQYCMVNTALTPTGYPSNAWFNNDNYDIKNKFLKPPMFSNILNNENWRRVASDSSIQNSLKCQNDQMAPPNNAKDSPFERVNSLKREQVNYQYQRYPSFTTYPIQNIHKADDISVSKAPVSSAVYSNMLERNSIDLNPDRSFGSGANVFRTHDNNRLEINLFDDMNSFRGDLHQNSRELPLSIEQESFVPMEVCDTFINPYVKESEAINPQNFNTMSINYPNIQSNCDNDSSADGHECYWGQSNDAEMVYTNEPSPKTKPCENLDPQNVLVDIKADFAGIPEIIVNDPEAQRRDSLNWTVEVLKSLNSESGTGDAFVTRDRSLSGYQPMIALTEEEKMSADIIEC